MSLLSLYFLTVITHIKLVASTARFPHCLAVRQMPGADTAARMRLMRSSASMEKDDSNAGVAGCGTAEDADGALFTERRGGGRGLQEPLLSRE